MIITSMLIRDIQRKFSNGCPNGYLLGWDVNRFFKPLLSLFAGFRVINETDFNYSYCNSYDIELGIGEDEKIYFLTLKASFIADIYTVHVTGYSKNKRRGKVVDVMKFPEYEKQIERARSFMNGQGFMEILDEDMELVVESVDLELAEHATLGKCLFDDFE